MATYNLTGAGVHGLTANTDRLFVEILTYPMTTRAGRATPANYYDVGLLRIGVQGAYGPTIPIDSSTIFIDLPQGATSLGYSLFETVAVQVTENVPPAISGEFGHNTIGGAGTDDTFNTVNYYKAASQPTTSGILDFIYVYAATANQTIQPLAAIYDDAGGVPGTLLGQSSAVTVNNTTPAWLQFAVNASISASTQYWFALVNPSYGGTISDFFVNFDTNGSVVEYMAESAAMTAFPPHATASVNITNERMSIYGTYT